MRRATLLKVISLVKTALTPSQGAPRPSTLNSLMETSPLDIVALRLCHCRAERAASEGALHVAAMHYRACLEAAERREDCQAMQFFAHKLGEVYDRMGLGDKADSFKALARA